MNVCLKLWINFDLDCLSSVRVSVRRDVDGRAEDGRRTDGVLTGGEGVGCSPWRLLPLVVVQVGGGEVCGRTTGAKALFCLTAETIWTGENE